MHQQYKTTVETGICIVNKQCIYKVCKGYIVKDMEGERNTLVKIKNGKILNIHGGNKNDKN